MSIQKEFIRFIYLYVIFYYYKWISLIILLLVSDYFNFELLKSIISIITVGLIYATIILIILYRKLLTNKARRYRYSRKYDWLYGNSLDLLEFNIKNFNVKIINYQRLFAMIFICFLVCHFKDNTYLLPPLKRAFEILIVVTFLFIFKIKISKK